MKKPLSIFVHNMETMPKTKTKTKMELKRSDNEEESITMNSSSFNSNESSIDTAEVLEEKEEVFPVSIETNKNQKPSDLGCYKETTSYKRWFQEHVVDNKRTSCAKSLVGELCGLKLKIYFGNSHKSTGGRDCRHRLPVNKIATMLTFDPNSGLYNHLIRGKAYVTLDGGVSKLSRRTVWAIQELIAEYKGKYHAYGADFSRQGQMELLKACVQYKKGKWVPRSVYGMAVAKTDATEEITVWNRRQFQTFEFHRTEEETDETMRRSSASHWFINAYQIEDTLQAD